MTVPGLLLFEDYGGNWEAYLDAVYAAYRADIVEGRPSFRGSRVAYRRHPETAGKGAGFWHVISEGKLENERTPDLRRCERVRWIRYIIDNVDASSGVTWWQNMRGNETNTLLWLHDEYVVILAERKDHHLLRTAFCTERRHRVDSLKRERDAWVQSRNG